MTPTILGWLAMTAEAVLVVLVGYAALVWLLTLGAP